MALCGSVLGQGPVSNYYLTNGDGGTNWLVLGTSATSFAQANPDMLGEYAISVTPSFVRTLHNGNDTTQGLGSEYTLGFVFTGNTFSFSPTRGFYDATNDGQFIYSVDFNNGEVVRMNLDWSSPTVLFDTGFGSANALGITYDTATNSLWVSQWGGTTVANFSLAGTPLSSFDAGFGTISSLAYNPISDTLWMGSQSNQGTFSEFSKAGALLQAPTYASMLSENTLGGEFVISAVPEPASLVLCGSGIAAYAGYVWRRRTRRK